MLQAGINQVFSRSTGSELRGGEVKCLVLMSELSLPVRLLLSQNSLPGGSFTQVNTDEESRWRLYLLCTWMLLQHKRRQVISLHKFHRIVYLRKNGAIPS